jgi:hypothetical protein
MAINWLQEGNSEGLQKHAMYRGQCANAMRGSEIRGLQLADRFIKVYEAPKPVVAVAVGSIKMNGKTNQVTTCSNQPAESCAWLTAAVMPFDQPCSRHIHELC